MPDPVNRETVAQPMVERRGRDSNVKLNDMQINKSCLQCRIKGYAD
jgi:hypothetical protein